MLFQRTIVFLLVYFLSISYCQASGSRVALVVGNGKYQDTDYFPTLDNPTNDAEDAASALRGFGFEVIERKNQTKEEMDAVITEFSHKIGSTGVALFYYAGHGLQVKGQNYLIPVDAKRDKDSYSKAPQTGAYWKYFH